MALATLTSSIISVILSTISILLVLFQQRGKIAVSCSETQFKNSYAFKISITNVGRQPVWINDLKVFSGNDIVSHADPMSYSGPFYRKELLQPGKQIRYSYVLVEKIPITRVVIHTDRVIHYLSHIQSIVVVLDKKEYKD